MVVGGYSSIALSGQLIPDRLYCFYIEQSFCILCTFYLIEISDWPILGIFICIFIKNLSLQLPKLFWFCSKYHIPSPRIIIYSKYQIVNYLDENNEISFLHVISRIKEREKNPSFGRLRNNLQITRYVRIDRVLSIVIFNTHSRTQQMWTYTVQRRRVLCEDEARMTAMTQDWPCVSFIFPPSPNYIRLNRHVATCSAIKPLYSRTVRIILFNRPILSRKYRLYYYKKITPRMEYFNYTNNKKQKLEPIRYFALDQDKCSSF